MPQDERRHAIGKVSLIAGEYDSFSETLSTSEISCSLLGKQQIVYARFVAAPLTGLQGGGNL